MSFSALVFVLAFLAGCVLALARHPMFGLITYVAVFYLHPPSRWWGQGILLDIRWAFIAAGATLLAMLIHRPREPVAPTLRTGLFWGFVLLLMWIGLQYFWALDREAHLDLLTIYGKFLLVMLMITRCIENESHVRYFLWAHVLGCFYLGWLAFASHSGGRLDGVGGPGIDEANAAALQMTTGILAAASLFLTGKSRQRAGLLALIPIMVNGLVATISRSGFLAAAVGGIVFNLFSPRAHRGRVRLFSVLALALFALLTNDVYWNRMATIKLAGEEIEGVDTGGGRLQTIEAQIRMFEGRPLGCGHMCTTVLSPSYLDARFLSDGARASHNTFMTMLVDHGIVGAAIYLMMLVWVARNLRRVRVTLKSSDGFLACVLPGVAAILAAITVGDLFAQYPKFEARIWFLSLLVVLVHLAGRNANTVTQGTP